MPHNCLACCFNRLLRTYRSAMSEFWARKIRTYFSKIDVNSDGFISKKDAVALADNLTDQAKSSLEQRAKTRNHNVEVNCFNRAIEMAGMKGMSECYHIIFEPY